MATVAQADLSGMPRHQCRTSLSCPRASWCISAILSVQHQQFSKMLRSGGTALLRAVKQGSALGASLSRALQSLHRWFHVRKAMSDSSRCFVVKMVLAHTGLAAACSMCAQNDPPYSDAQAAPAAVCASQTVHTESAAARLSSRLARGGAGRRRRAWGSELWQWVALGWH